MQTQTIPPYLSALLPHAALPAHLPGMRWPLLQHARENALRDFLRQGLPTQSQEDWRYTQLRAIEKTPLQPPRAKDLEPIPVNACALLGARQHRLAFVDGVLRHALGPHLGLPAGIHIASLQEALERNEFAAHRLLTTETINPDSWHGLNAALCEGGLMLEAAPHTSCAEPVEILFLNSGAHKTNHTRHHVHLGEGAALHLILRMLSYNDVADKTDFSTLLTHVQLDAGASFECTLLQENAAQSFTLLHDEVKLAESAKMTMNIAHLGGQITRHRAAFHLGGERAAVELRALTFVNGAAHTDLVTNTHHNAPHTTSHQHIRSLAGGKSRAVFQGNVRVDQAAQETLATQNHQGLLLSDAAEIDAKPGLEIHADAVQCSHGNTCGALDETALFYMQSRGIPRGTAETLLLNGIATDLFEPMAHAPLRDALLARIHQKLIAP